MPTYELIVHGFFRTSVEAPSQEEAWEDLKLDVADFETTDQWVENTTD